MEVFSEKIAAVTAPFEQWGLLESLPPEHEEVNFEKIFVRTREGDIFSAEAQTSIAEVMIENAAVRLMQTLNEKLASDGLAPPSVCLAQASLDDNTLFQS